MFEIVIFPFLSVGALTTCGGDASDKNSTCVSRPNPLTRMYFLVSSQPGPDNCVENVIISESMKGDSIRIDPGIVCIKCSIGDGLATDAEFLIHDAEIGTDMGRIVDGVLVVFDTESVFTTAEQVQCMSVSHNSVLMYINGKSYSTRIILLRACVYTNYYSHPGFSNLWKYHPQ